MHLLLAFRKYKTILMKIKAQRAEVLERILRASLISQLAIIVISILRIPISLHFFGIEDYGMLVIFLVYWKVIVIFGESARKAWRMQGFNLASMPIFSFNRVALYWYLIMSTTVSVTIGVSLGVSGFIMSNIVAGAGLIHLRYAPYAGILELNGFYEKTNWFQLASNLLFFAPWYLACHLGNEYLYLITACAAFPLSSYICKLACSRNLMSTQLKVSQRQHKESNFGKYLSLAFVSKTTYLLDPFLIQSQLGALQVVVHSIYQKFLNLYSLTPGALSPIFMVESSSGHAKNLSRKAEKYLVFITLLITVILFVFNDHIFDFLSRGKIASNTYLLTLVVVQGVIGSLITKGITSSNSLEQLTLRIRVAILGTIVSATGTYLLLPIFGIGVSFITSILYSICTFFCLRKLNSAFSVSKD
jgi:hypothetical protein